MKRSRVTSYLGIISLGLAIIPGILVYFSKPDYNETIILVPGLLFSSLIVSSIVGSYFELQLRKRRWGPYSNFERESVGRVFSLSYGITFLLLGILLSVVTIIFEISFLFDFVLLYISWIISGILGIVGAIMYRDSPQNISSVEVIKRRKIGFTVIMICSFIIVSSILLINTSSSYYRTLNVNQDAYVYEYHPDTNYGEEALIYVGNYKFGKTEAYYRFDVSGFEGGWNDAYLEVKFNFASCPVNVGACIIFESWDEMSITWNNKPNRTALYGRIICDGFDFNVPVKPKHFINNEITICLYGIGGESDGYLLGTSKEGASSDDYIPLVHLQYKGIDPNFYFAYIIVYLVEVAITVLYLIYAGKSSYSRVPQSSPTPFQRFPRPPLDESLLRQPPRHPVIRPTRRDLQRFRDLYKPKEIYKINELVDLRLIGNRTYIFVNNRRLIVCAFLLINIPKDRIHDYDDIRSIDEAAESSDTTPPFYYRITPEEEFRAHCSNIQAFFENGLNTDILHTNIAFPLLKELVRQGFQPAEKVFKEEIAKRFNEGTYNSRRFLYLRGYLNYLSKEEKQVLRGYDDFIKRLPKRATPFIHEFFMRERFLNERRENVRRDFERDAIRNPHKIVIFGDRGVGISTLNEKFLPNSRRMQEDYRLTLGLHLSIKNVNVNNQTFRLHIWNIAGGDQFRSLRPLYFEGASGGIFIYDITNKSSLAHLDDWLLNIRNRNRFPIIVVGNKLDLAEKRKVPVEEAIKLAKSRGMNGYIECSFQTGKNVEKIFERLIRLILKNLRDLFNL
ncbi:MAG: GTP-binding protein [Promethearchaeota archaeon]